MQRQQSSQALKRPAADLRPVHLSVAPKVVADAASHQAYGGIAVEDYECLRLAVVELAAHAAPYDPIAHWHQLGVLREREPICAEQALHLFFH